MIGIIEFHCTKRCVGRKNRIRWLICLTFDSSYNMLELKQ